MPEREVSDDVLEEGSYHLYNLGLSIEEIARKFEITKKEAAKFRESYDKKLKAGLKTVDDLDLGFWKAVVAESEGDSKITFFSGKGFHHAWVSDLKRMDGPSLMSIYEESRAFLELDPNRRFLDYPPPMGYDPLALQREVKKALDLISSLLEEKWRETEEKDAKATARTQLRG